MSVQLQDPESNVFTRPVHGALEFAIARLLAPVWLAVWLAVYPRGRDAVLWTYHDELRSARAGDRWRRALGFLLHLPQFASDQAAAEGDPATQTSGEPPGPPPPAPGGSGLGSPRKVVTILVGWAIAIALIVIAVVMWLDAFGSLFGLLDDETLSGDQVGALAAMVVVATAPLLAVHERRRFSWTPAHRSERDAGLPARAGWGLGLLVFAILAAVVWLRVIGEYFYALDATVAITFAEAFGLGVMALIAASPLGYVVWRRHTQRPLRAARWSRE